ncbi:MAG: putative Signal transduction histidine kinase [Rickettsiales bacterium]|jgi:two-component system osmolarity sensor histidine kinase EnvZ|nr:putative Signal transduction histidine kinase [Rickettsiales bacterium]
MEESHPKNINGTMALIKRLVPESLLGRFLLIILIPGIMLPAVTTYVFFERHWKSVTRHMTSSLAGEVALLVDAVIVEQHKLHPSKTLGKHATPDIDAEIAGPPVPSRYFQEAKDFLSLDVMWEKPGPYIPFVPTEEPSNHTEFEELFLQLKERITYPITLGYATPEADDIMIRVQLPDNRVMAITTSRKRIENPTTAVFVVVIAGTSTLLLLIAILFTRNQIRSIVTLADAAEQFGRGNDLLYFKPSGAKEVRQAGLAFLDMKERILRQVEQRTAMLAGISHDLRTPLTRMRLQLTLMKDAKNPTSAPSEEILYLEEDIDVMEQMIQEYLDFARGDGQEQAVPSVLRDCLKQIIAGYRNHRNNVTLHMEQDVTLPLKPRAFGRVMTNLIDNGLRFGKHVDIQVSTREQDKHVTLFIDDDGPGIPALEQENVFRPFYRLERSRNSDTGGAGLGMSIARDIVNSHGGHLSLDQSAKGGLRVKVTLPL